MITLQEQGSIYRGDFYPAKKPRKKTELTIAEKVLGEAAHDDALRLRFDAVAVHDAAYVRIIQAARASGIRAFDQPLIMGNCYDASGADVHAYGYSAAQKYGGIYLPPHMAVLHQYMREAQVRSGGLYVGAFYGALGALGFRADSAQVTQQLLGKRYAAPLPDSIAVHLSGKPAAWVGPQDIALALLQKIQGSHFATGAVLEFIGEGLRELSMDMRFGIDAALAASDICSTIWETDENTRAFFKTHGRLDDYMRLMPDEGAWYDRVMHVDLSRIEPMIALPFDMIFSIEEFKRNMADILHDAQKRSVHILGEKVDLLAHMRKRDLIAQQGIVAGCGGGLYENIARMADILRGVKGASPFALSVYPASVPVQMRCSAFAQVLLGAGGIMHASHCGYCHDSGNLPAQGQISLQHMTGNTGNPYVLRMDARSIAATARNGGLLTAANECATEYAPIPEYRYEKEPYARRVYLGFGNAKPSTPLAMGSHISDWPLFDALNENMLLIAAAVLPADTRSMLPPECVRLYRDDPICLSECLLDAQYRARAAEIAAMQVDLANYTPDSISLLERITDQKPVDASKYTIGSFLCAPHLWDGAAQEESAYCQRILGGLANICMDYADAYRGYLQYWGLLPLICPDIMQYSIQPGDIVYISGLKTALEQGETHIAAQLIQGGARQDMECTLPFLKPDDRAMIIEGGLINYHTKRG